MAVSATTLRPFFNQAVYGTAVLDYAVASIDSEPMQWWLPENAKLSGKSAAKNRDIVTVIRKGDFILPVTLEVVFDDGSRRRELWDGADRWHRYTYETTAKIVSAEIDPDHLILLDRDFFNNSITTRTTTLPTRKLAALWNAMQQFLSQLAAWLV